MNPPPIPRGERSRLDGLAFGLLALGVVAFLSLSTLHRVQRERADQAATVVALGQDVRLDLKGAHIAVKEFVAGATNVNPAIDVDARYAHALRLIDQL
ncbi:MAG: hypothetical protein FJ363_06770 [Gemmatimonadetes bacterium]|nr:hypothetical protein [Gemmatimonadota bacterium]